MPCPGVSSAGWVRQCPRAGRASRCLTPPAVVAAAAYGSSIAAHLAAEKYRRGDDRKAMDHLMYRALRQPQMQARITRLELAVGIRGTTATRGSRL